MMSSSLKWPLIFHRLLRCYCAPVTDSLPRSAPSDAPTMNSSRNGVTALPLTPACLAAANAVSRTGHALPLPKPGLVGTGFATSRAALDSSSGCLQQSPPPRLQIEHSSQGSKSLVWQPEAREHCRCREANHRNRSVSPAAPSVAAMSNTDFTPALTTTTGDWWPGS